MGKDRLEGKVAVVTGGASGIGLATVHRLVADGAKVAIGDIDEAGLGAVAAELGDAVVTARCDVTVEADVEGLVAAAVDRFGGLHAAFANAGIGDFGVVAALDPDRFRQVLDINLLGPALTIKHASARMDDGGSIVITASLNAVQPAAGMSAYCCSKAGAAMLAQVAAMELGPRRIRVNAVGPGLVRTGLTEGMWMLPELVEEYQGNQVIPEQITAEDIAATVAFLVSDDARAITGTLQLVDGGGHTKRYPEMLRIFGLT
jgi:NAD(P)-dependent dehydrogenase (short-subunit alcohol dehydrogenase family)